MSYFVVQGFHKVYHKEEFGHKKKFWDNKDHKKHYKTYDHLDKYFKKHNAGHHKGKKYKVRKFSALYKIKSIIHN